MSNKGENRHSEDAPGQNKIYTIVINGVQVTTDKHKLSYEDILRLQNLQIDTENPYLVAYDRGAQGNASGNISPGEDIVVKDGMVFNVTPTNKS